MSLTQPPTAFRAALGLVLRVALGAVLLASGASAQLDLPRGQLPKPKPKQVVILPSGPSRTSLLEETFGDPEPESTAGQVDAADAEPATAKERPASELLLPRGPQPGSPGDSMDSTPAEVLEAFERLIRMSLNKEAQAAGFEALCAMGPPAFELARSLLGHSSPRRALLAGRVLLAAGGSEERGRLRTQLSGEVQAKVGPILLRELAERDPLLAHPDFLMGMLEHPQGCMREVAASLIEERLDASWLPLLVAASSSPKHGLRLQTVRLASQLQSPAARRLMIAALEDPRSSVALLAAQALAHWSAEGHVEQLHGLVFGEGAWDRSRAWGLLALVQREDNLGLSILQSAQVPALLVALEDRRELVSGVAAAALAGIGFRSPAGTETPWLTRRVPDTLVRLSTGYVFHKDLEALQSVGLARLALISGESLGGSGSAWQAWWAENWEHFRPRRSALTPGPNDERNLRVTWIQGAPDARQPRTLVGPAAAPQQLHGEAEPLYLTHGQALGLMALVEAQGLFSAEQLPGRRGAVGSSPSVLRIALPSGEKVFEAAREGAPAWFTTLGQRVEELWSAQRWQHWFDPGLYASSFDFYVAEGPWWEAAPADQREERLKRLMLDALARLEPDQRGPGLTEFSAHVRHHNLLSPSDFVPLMGLLKGEQDYGTRFSSQASSRARDLVALAMESTRSPSGVSSSELLEKLFEHLLQHYGSAAREDLEQLLGLAGGELLWSSAQSLQPVQRMVSARPLAALAVAAGREAVEPTPSALNLLLELCKAPEPPVAEAALEAVGEFGVQACRPVLVLRAQEAGQNPLEVRAAALRNLGRLGGQGVRELCVLALGESDPRLVIAGAEGLASSRDEKNASLLASLLERGPASGFFEAVSAGLDALGSAAVPALLPLGLSSDRSVRRQAALLLSAQGVPEAASQLLMLLTENPQDARVAEELAILSCRDLRAAQDPVAAWWSWWDSVVHDDSGAWFQAAMERAGYELASSSVPRELQASFGLGDLLGWVGVNDLILRERLRREFFQLLGPGVPPLPSDPSSSAAWAAQVRELRAGD